MPSLTLLDHADGFGLGLWVGNGVRLLRQKWPPIGPEQFHQLLQSRVWFGLSAADANDGDRADSESLSQVEHLEAKALVHDSETRSGECLHAA